MFARLIGRAVVLAEKVDEQPAMLSLGPGGEAHLARRSTEVVHEQNRIVPPEPTCQMFELRTANAGGCKPMILLLARKLLIAFWGWCIRRAAGGCRQASGVIETSIAIDRQEIQ